MFVNIDKKMMFFFLIQYRTVVSVYYKILNTSFQFSVWFQHGDPAQRSYQQHSPVSRSPFPTNQGIGTGTASGHLSGEGRPSDNTLSFR